MDESELDQQELLELKGRIREHPSYATWKAKAKQVGNSLTEEERAIKEQYCDVVTELWQREQREMREQGEQRHRERQESQMRLLRQIQERVEGVVTAVAMVSQSHPKAPMVPVKEKKPSPRPSVDQPRRSQGNPSNSKSRTHDVSDDSDEDAALVDAALHTSGEDSLPGLGLMRGLQLPGLATTSGQATGDTAIGPPIRSPSPPPGSPRVDADDSSRDPEKNGLPDTKSAPTAVLCEIEGPSRYSISPRPATPEVSKVDDTERNKMRLQIEEALKPPDEQKWVLHPTTSRFRKNWDLAMSVIIIYIALYLPFQVSFGHDMHPVHNNLDQVLDILFIFDIALNFRTGYVKTNGTVEMRPNKIAWDYFTSWFPIDFVSAIPFDFIFILVELAKGSSGSSEDTDSGEGSAVESVAKFNKVVRLLKMARILKILRVLRLGRILRRVTKMLGIGLGTITISKFFLHVFVSCHWVACIFYWVAEQQGDRNWVAYLPEEWGDMSDLTNAYIVSMYHAVMTMSTLGSPVDPVTNVERVLTVVATLAGICFFAYGITNMCALVFTLDFEETAYRNVLDRMNEFFSANHVSKTVRNKCREHLDFMHSQHHFLDDTFVLDYLSPELMNDVKMEVYKNIFYRLSTATGLGLLNDEFLLSICDKFRADYYLAGEVVFLKGDMCRHLYYIESGSLILDLGSTNKKSKWSKLTVVAKTLLTGDLYGEEALVAPFPHRYSGKAGAGAEGNHIDIRLISRRAIEEEILPRLKGKGMAKAEWAQFLAAGRAKTRASAKLKGNSGTQNNFMEAISLLRTESGVAAGLPPVEAKEVQSMFGHNVKIKMKRQSTIAPGSLLDIPQQTGGQQDSWINTIPTGNKEPAMAPRMI